MLIIVSALAACAPVTQTNTIDKPLGAKTYVSVGDVILRVDAKESLPNVLGNADIFGRTRDRGFSEIRYMGLNPASQPVFRRSDTEILTNETAMTRAGSSATVMSNNGSVFGSATSPQAEKIQALPAQTTEFTVDLAKNRTITIRNHSIEIVEATSSGVTFIPR